MYFPCLSLYFLAFVCSVITWWAGPGATVGHAMCRTMVEIQSVAAEIRREKKKEEEDR